MSKLGRTIGLVGALAMFAVSAYFYLQTGDWVAALFAAGSLAYFVFFYSVSRGGKP